MTNQLQKYSKSAEKLGKIVDFDMSEDIIEIKCKLKQKGAIRKERKRVRHT